MAKFGISLQGCMNLFDKTKKRESKGAITNVAQFLVRCCDTV